MFAFLSAFFKKKRIDLFAPISLSDCKIVKPYLLEKAGISSGTAVILAIPYYSKACADPDRNLSAYAVGRNYHAFFESIFDELIPALKKAFPNEICAGFADHSPIDERLAAVQSGIGIFGQNGMVITEPYSSYVFLGELITTAKFPTELHEIRSCEGCGACKKACPMETLGTCLSALTQKKGDLTEEESASILRFGSVWGCDICQEVCPHTVRAIRSGSIYSPIPFFSEETVSHLTLDLLDGMSDDVFLQRAYSWRGRDPIRRNLLLKK